MSREMSQEIARAYVFVLSGCLQRAVRDFKPMLNIFEAPTALSFTGFTGKPFSFDLTGYAQTSEVLVESKGYRPGDTLLGAYRTFLAKAYCTFVQFSRYQRSQFWFVSNVPIGATGSVSLVDPHFVEESLRQEKPVSAAAILGDAPIDRRHVRTLASRLAMAIFTDSFIKVMGTSYRFQPGDSIWSVTRLLHGGRIPVARFATVESRVAYMNNLRDPNRVRSGQRLHMPWFGIPDYWM